MNDEAPEMPLEAQARIEAIYQKIGRNVWHLQRLEVMLKGMLMLNFEAPVNEVVRTLEAKKKELTRRMLGPLTDEAIDELFPDPSRRSMLEGPITEVWLSHRIGFEDDQHKEFLRQQLKSLVNDRNQLIHHMFGGYDHLSKDSCANFEKILDGQLGRILEVMNWIRELGELMVEGHQELIDKLMAAAKR